MVNYDYKLKLCKKIQTSQIPSVVLKIIGRMNREKEKATKYKLHRSSARMRKKTHGKKKIKYSHLYHCTL